MVYVETASLTNSGMAPHCLDFQTFQEPHADGDGGLTLHSLGSPRSEMGRYGAKTAGGPYASVPACFPPLAEWPNGEMDSWAGSSLEEPWFGSCPGWTAGVNGRSPSLTLWMLGIRHPSSPASVQLGGATLTCDLLSTDSTAKLRWSFTTQGNPADPSSRPHPQAKALARPGAWPDCAGVLRLLRHKGQAGPL